MTQMAGSAALSEPNNSLQSLDASLQQICLLQRADDRRAILRCLLKAKRALDAQHYDVLTPLCDKLSHDVLHYQQSNSYNEWLNDPLAAYDQAALENCAHLAAQLRLQITSNITSEQRLMALNNLLEALALALEACFEIEDAQWAVAS